MSSTIEQTETVARRASGAARQPSAAETTTIATPAPAPAKNGTNRVPLIITLTVVAVLGAFGVRQWLFSRNHVGTDNAQVEGHIVPVLAKVGGFVSEVRVNENQNVRGGDTLVVLDDRDYDARLAQTDGDLAGSIATAGSAKRSGQAGAQLAAARANVTQAEANAWRAHADLDRTRGLVNRGVVGRQSLDDAEAAAKAADAQLAAAHEQVSAAAAGVSGAEAKVEANAAARDLAALQLSYTRVLAPANGVVSRKTVEVGQLVQVGQPLMTIVPLDDVWVVANLKETEVRDVTPGDAVDIRVDAYPGHKFRGHVESMSPASGARFSLLPPDNSTGNFTKVVQRIPVRIRIDGAQDPQALLRPGMSADVTVTTK